MTFSDAIKTAYVKYADFNGRATRQEYWLFILFFYGVLFVLRFLPFPIALVFWLGTIVPVVAAGSRRLHDANQTGWLQLLYLVPLLGWLILLVLMCQAPREPNRYGPAQAEV